MLLLLFQFVLDMGDRLRVSHSNLVLLLVSLLHLLLVLALL